VGLYLGNMGNLPNSCAKLVSPSLSTSPQEETEY